MAVEGHQAYAPREYVAAREAVGRLDAELRAQTDRFALARSYDRVTQHAAEVETAADTVYAVVDAEKVRLQIETRGFIADAEPALDDAWSAIDELADEHADGLRTDVEDVESSLAAVESDLQAGKYAGAHQGARSALTASTRHRKLLGGDGRRPRSSRRGRGDPRSPRGFDLPRRAYATGEPLEPAPYRVRLTDESAPVVDQEPPTTTRWIEFLHEEDGSIAGRALATVVPDVRDRRSGRGRGTT